MLICCCCCRIASFGGLARAFKFFQNWQIMNASGYMKSARFKSTVNIRILLNRKIMIVWVRWEPHQKIACVAYCVSSENKWKRNGSKKIQLSWLIWQWGLHSHNYFSAALLRFTALVVYRTLFDCARACLSISQSIMPQLTILCVCSVYRSGYAFTLYSICP